MNEIKFQGAVLIKPRDLVNQLDPKGKFHIEHWRDGKLLQKFEVSNGVTNEGKNFILDVMFHGETSTATWYLGLIDDDGYSALAATDTYDNINQIGNGWDEFPDYGAGDRIEWVEGAAAAQAISNSLSVATFNITGSGTVKGCFLVGIGAAADTVGDHAADGILWATALFSAGDVVVAVSDQLKVTYTVSA